MTALDINFLNMMTVLIHEKCPMFGMKHSQFYINKGQIMVVRNLNIKYAKTHDNIIQTFFILISDLVIAGEKYIPLNNFVNIRK